MTLTWSLMIDWDGDGVLDTDEASRMTGLVTRRGRPYPYGSSGPEAMRVGRAVVTLDNHDMRYSAWNASGPLYGDLVPGRDAWLTVTDDDSGMTYDVIRGQIIEPSVTGRDKAQIVIEDGWRWLTNRVADIHAQEDIGTGEAIQQILEQVEWPERDWCLGEAGYSELGETTWLAPEGGSIWSWGKSISPGRDVIPWWWGAGNAARQINDLMRAEHGIAYIAADGRFVYLDRDDLYESSSEETLTEDKLLVDIDMGQPSDGLFSQFEVVFYQRTLAAAATVLWELDDEITLAAGEERQITASYDAATDLITPTSGTDYQMWSVSGGSGSDLSGSLAVVADLNGETATLRLTNNASVTGYITVMQLRGYLLEVTSEGGAYLSDDDIIDLYGPSQITIDVPWIQAAGVAQDYARWMSAWLTQIQPLPKVRIEARPSLQFEYDLATHLTLDVDTYGYDGDVRIGYIQHRWLQPGGQAVETTWYLEPVRQEVLWRLGVSGRSELGDTTYLGY